jgi:hypothetical protein
MITMKMCSDAGKKEAHEVQRIRKKDMEYEEKKEGYYSHFMLFGLSLRTDHENCFNSIDRVDHGAQEKRATSLVKWSHAKQSLII